MTSRLEGIGRVGSPAPMFIELGTSLVKAMLWWRGVVWWDRPKTIGRLGDIGFFTLKKGKYTLYTEEEYVLGL